MAPSDEWRQEGEHPARRPGFEDLTAAAASSERRERC
jgi:hypothetical protein